MSDEENINRRKVLKGAATAGSMALFGTTTVGASPDEASVDIDSLMVSDKITTLREEIPGLELYSDRARVIGGEDGIIGIPANYGTLITRPPKESISERDRSRLETDRDNPSVERPEVDAASFYFDEWVPGVDSDWSKGTQARLRVSDNGAVLTRQPTDAEAEQILESVGQTDIDQENMAIGVETDSGKVTITHVDTENRQLNRIQAEPTETQTGTTKNGLSAAKSELEVTKNETKEIPSVSQVDGMSDPCSLDSVIVCVIEAQSCWPCLIAGVTGPVALACWFFVCLGFPAEPIVSILSDVGCLSLAGCAAGEITDMVDEVLDEYADEIPV